MLRQTMGGDIYPSLVATFISIQRPWTLSSVYPGFLKLVHGLWVDSTEDIISRLVLAITRFA